MKYLVNLQQVLNALKTPTYFFFFWSFIFCKLHFKGQIGFKKILLKTQIAVAIMNINKTN